MRTRTKRTAALVAGLTVLVSGIALAEPARRTARLSGDTYGGDPNATGRAVLRVDVPGNKVCFRITYRRLAEPNFGGLYRGNEYGSALEVTLFNGDRGPRSSPIRGCARDLPRPILREIEEHPRRFWVKTSKYGYANSALSGRLHRPS